MIEPGQIATPIWGKGIAECERVQAEWSADAKHDATRRRWRPPEPCASRRRAAAGARGRRGREGHDSEATRLLCRRARLALAPLARTVAGGGASLFTRSLPRGR